MSDANVFYAEGAALVFPENFKPVSLAEWRNFTGNDKSSVDQDPHLAAPSEGNFSLLAGSPAWLLGWKAIDITRIGPIAQLESTSFTQS